MPARRIYQSLLITCLIAQLQACGSPRILPSESTTAYPAHDTSQGTQSAGKPAQVISVAKSMLGKPYHYGGLSPSTGFDCSGLVYFAHRRVGRTLPRTSYGQFKATKPVHRNGLKPGDLVFFRIKRNRISHVGIYLGDQRFIHAPSSGKSVNVASLDNPYWRKRFVRGGRVF